MCFGWFSSQAVLHTQAPSADRPDVLFGMIPKATSDQAAFFLEIYALAVDGMTIGCFLFGILGYTIRPFIALAACFLLRQLVMVAGTHSNPIDSMWTPPKGIWHYRGLFVSFAQYEHALSGGILIASCFMLEIVRTLKECFPNGAATTPRWASWAQSFSLLLVVGVLGGLTYLLVALRAEWTTDILISVVFGQYASAVAHLWAPKIEGWLP